MFYWLCRLSGSQIEADAENAAEAEIASEDGNSEEAPQGDAISETPKSDTPSTSKGTSSTPFTSQVKKTKAVKRNRVCDEADVTILKYLKDCAKSREKEDTSCEFLFGKMVTASLLKLAPRNQSLAKLKIQQVLFDMEERDLSTSNTSAGNDYMNPPAESDSGIRQCEYTNLSPSGSSAGSVYTQSSYGSVSSYHHLGSPDYQARSSQM